MLESAIRIKNNIDKSKLDYSQIHLYKEFLQVYDSLSFGYGFTVIFDIAKHCFFYISSDRTVVPKRDNAFVENEGYKAIIENVHPDDIIHFIEVKNYVVNYFNNTLKNKKDKLIHKFILKLRLLADNNLYVVYYLQIRIIKLDNKDNAWLILCKGVPAKSQNMKFPVIITNINNRIPKIIDLYNSKIVNLPKLTSRERQILKLLYQNKTTPDIALILNIEENSVKSYKSKLFKKLYAHNVITALENAKLFCMI